MARGKSKIDFATISDCHVGNHGRWGGPVVDGLNARCRLTLGALQAAVDAAAKAGAGTLYVAGDLFHVRRPEPAVIAAVQRIFSRDDIRIVVVPGNHDLLDASAAGGNTAAAPLWRQASLGNQEALFGSVLAVPFTATMPMAEWLETVLLAERYGQRVIVGARVLVTHVGVFDEKDAAAHPWMRRAPDAISAPALFDLMERAGIRLALVGNYHRHRVWERDGLKIVQVGTLAPGSFSDEGTEGYGRVALVNEGDLGVRFVEVPGPRFVTATKASTVPVGKHVFARFVDCVPTDESLYGGVELVSSADHCSSFPVSNEGKKQEQALSPEAAIRGYIAGMELPEGFDAREVEALVVDCWKKGA